MSEEGVDVEVAGKQWPLGCLTRLLIVGLALTVSAGCLLWYFFGSCYQDLSLALFSVTMSTVLTVGLVDLLLGMSGKIHRQEQRKVVALEVACLVAKQCRSWLCACAMFEPPPDRLSPVDVFQTSTLDRIRSALSIHVASPSNSIGGLGGPFVMNLREGADEAEKVLLLHNPHIDGRLRRLLLNVAWSSRYPSDLEIRVRTAEAGEAKSIQLSELSFQGDVAKYWCELADWLKEDLDRRGRGWSKLFDDSQNSKELRRQLDDLHSRASSVRTGGSGRSDPGVPPV